MLSVIRCVTGSLTRETDEEVASFGHAEEHNIKFAYCSVHSNDRCESEEQPEKQSEKEAKKQMLKVLRAEKKSLNCNHTVCVSVSAGQGL